ncbi:MAG: ABC transporter permease subunit [Anaerolineae bacterium]
MVNLFKHELFSRWVAILGWGIALSAFSAMYITIYPQVAEEMAGLADLSIYQAMGIDLGSFAGYIASVVIQIMPIILGIYVIMTSTATLAGEEDNGTLELVVAMPLPRWQIVAMKTAALAVVIFLIMVIMGLGSALSLAYVRQTTAVDAMPLQIFFALLGAYPLMLAFFGIGLFLGTITPNRRSALVIMTVIYVGSYLLNSVAGLVEALSWVGDVSLFSYVNTTATVFTEGLDPLNMVFLLGIFMLFFAGAVFVFQRRNITVGSWIWQQPQLD